MAKYSIEDTTLTALGDAVRDKTGKLTRPIYENTDVFTVEIPITQIVNHNFPVSGVRSVVIRIMEENFAGPTYYLVNLNTNTETKINFSNSSSPEIVKEATLRTLEEDCEYNLEVRNMWKDGYVATIKLIYYDANNKLIQVPIYIKNTMTPSQMIEEIENIKEYVEPIPPAIQTLEIVNNGTYIAPEGIDGYNPITVNVPQDGGPTDKELTITGICSYRFANGGWDWTVKKYGNKITTKDISNATHMFESCSLSRIPFDLNFKENATISNYQDIEYMFYNSKIETIPKLNKLRPRNMNRMFYNAYYLREIPEESIENIDWDYLLSQTSSYVGNSSEIFYGCASLRSIPINMLKKHNPYASYSYSIYKGLCEYCYSLDELINIPFPHFNASWTSNGLDGIVENCQRLKNLTFALQEDGSPYVCNWRGQTLDLSRNTGWSYAKGTNSGIVKYGSITVDKEVIDDVSYQALKDDPDWWSANVAYSRYNHDSAVATINSLPDVSASGGTNTIKFKGAAGELTDGGAINTLTEEEIAVAAAKGWTVSLV